MSLLSKLLGWMGGSPTEVPVVSAGVYRARKAEVTPPTPMPVLDVSIAHVFPHPHAEAAPSLTATEYRDLNIDQAFANRSEGYVQPFSPVEPSTYVKPERNPWGNQCIVTGLCLTDVQRGQLVARSGVYNPSGMNWGNTYSRPPGLPAWLTPHSSSGSFCVYDVTTGQYQPITSADNRSIIRPDLLDKLTPHERAQLLAFFNAAQSRSHGAFSG